MAQTNANLIWMTEHMAQTNANLIWKIADLLRGSSPTSTAM